MKRALVLAVVALLVAGCSGGGGGGKGGDEDATASASATTTAASERTTAAAGGSTRVVGKAPVPTFTFAPKDPAPGDVVTFKGKATDADGFIAAWSWNFGDGTNGTGQNTTHAFAAEAVFDVRLTVQDDDGNSVPLVSPVTVKAKAPTVGFTFTPADAAPGDTVTFYSTSRDDDGSIVDYQWDFNDDSTQSGAAARNVTHAFDIEGSFSVRLKVVDDDGASATTTKAVGIKAKPPTATFSTSPASPKVGDSVTFTAVASDPDGTITEYAWDFKDGDKGTGETTAHTFTVAGTYAVALRVKDDDGATASVTKNVVIAP